MMTRHARAIEEDRDEEAALHLAPAEDDDVPVGSGAPPKAPRPQQHSSGGGEQPHDAPQTADDGAQLRPGMLKMIVLSEGLWRLAAIHRLDYTAVRSFR